MLQRKRTLIGGPVALSASTLAIARGDLNVTYELGKWSGASRRGALRPLSAEHRVDVGERSEPAAELEAAGGIFLRPPGACITAFGLSFKLLNQSISAGGKA
jgi:hypothetical protein